MTDTRTEPPIDHAAPTGGNNNGGLKFCLFGALVIFAAVLITVGIVFMEARTFSSEEGAWKKIGESFEYDSQSEGWVVEFGIGYSRVAGYSQIVLKDEADDLLYFFRLDADPDVAQTLMDVDASKLQRTVTGSGTIRVQGRELPYVDYEQPHGDEGRYRGRMIDLSPPEADRHSLIEFLRPLDGDPITDADVQRELKTFHIGPER